ncbi:hypothetical protein VIGAN_03023100 [Vigna angularis var. angularis]|uniref:RRM domain-containing protein n=1 Tax=Vigna angularis var. angularis TaxID=157739 RepID=A0A0S3RJI4_PHAAN|nr:hypothetical protein VIGAN_03023100 [Vigna angularis var. angularis]
MESDLGKLFIGGISWDTDEERLREYFGKYGEVIEAVIMRDRTTGRARGFGFVVFSDPVVAERVIMDKHIIDGRTVEAKKAVPRDDQITVNRQSGTIQGSPGPGRTKKIFVGGLPSTITESDFKKYFDQFGTITDVVVMYDHNTQRPRGFGFITYDSEEAVDRVLYKTFHELNGKMVEVKRAVPKELSPGPSRSPLVGYNYSLNRTGSLLNSYAQGFNMSPIGNYGVKMEGRFSPLTSARSGFTPFGSNGYGMGVNLDSGLNPSYGGTSGYGGSLGYGRINPLYNGNPNRYTTPIGNIGGSGRSDALMNSASRSVWGNGGLNSAAANNPSSPGNYLGSGSGAFGVSIGNSGPNWGSSVPTQGGGAASGYSTWGNTYEGGDNSIGLGGGGYGRNSSPSVPQSSTFTAPTGGYEGSYGDLYRSGSVYSDSTWQSAASEIDASGSFGYGGLGGIASEDPVKSSEGFIGNYNVISRQTNRGKIFGYNS